MNCKPGDLAVIVRDPEDENIGITVAVLKRGRQDWIDDGRFHWIVKSRQPMLTRLYDGHLEAPDLAWCRVAHVPHADLLPIRDPGEDATDEMLLLVGRPNERVPA